MKSENQPNQNTALGWTIRLASIPAVLGAIVAMALIDEEYGLFATPALGLAALIATIGIGTGIWRYGSRHLQPSASELLATDPRPPVLYLRSFSNETTVGDEELAISRALEELGPFVAIGRPGERLPQLGAARMYLTDDSWQGEVQSLMARARFVIVAAGDTPGLGWEISQCAKIDDPRKLIFLVPNDEQSYSGFRKIAAANGLRLPNFPAKEHRKFATSRLAAMLIYDANWQAKWVKLPKAQSRDINLHSSENRGGRAWAAMQIIAKRQGIDLPSPPINPVSIYLRFILWFAVLPGILLLVVWVGAIALGYFDIDCTSPNIRDCINTSP